MGYALILCVFILKTTINLSETKLRKGDIPTRYLLKFDGTIDEVKSFTKDLEVKEILPGYFSLAADGPLTKSAASVAEADIDGMIRQNKKFKSLEEETQYYRSKRSMSQKRIQRAVTVSDANWADQWHLDPSHSPYMGVYNAWDNGYTGQGVTVAIVDDGIDVTHIDLADNYDASLSIDIIYNNPDPSHVYTSEGHGTNCAGIVAAVKNGHCVIGIAYEAKMPAIRLLDLDTGATALDEASALIHELEHIDIYSNSWGPADDGAGFDPEDGITAVQEAALLRGVTEGRNGKGAIYTWAAGNGGGVSDDCNVDGYSNTIYTISITSLGPDSAPAWYAEECTAILAAAYGGDDTQDSIATTSPDDQCIDDFQGTSAACPVASGIIALTLEAKFLSQDPSHSPSMGVYNAWDNGYTGQGVTVAIVDDGIDVTHIDLADNYDASLSIDIIYNNPDPSHVYTSEGHGTNCAGIVAAVKNGHCVIGIAYEAKMPAIRLLDLDTGATALDEASALIHELEHIDIYSNSWGPADDGAGFDPEDGITAVQEAALLRGVTEGRNGKGAIYTWAAGNGGGVSDDCNVDGYSNTIYTISITSLGPDSAPAWYAEECTAILAAAYGGDDTQDSIATTSPDDQCIDDFQGTSAACPVASGIIALTLEAKSFSGLTSITSNWTNDNCLINYLEHVYINIHFEVLQRPNTKIYLVSPEGTESRILRERPNDAETTDVTWRFMSVHTWGESPSGTWTLRMDSSSSINVMNLYTWSLTFYGTSTDPLLGTPDGSDNTALIIGATIGAVAAVGITAGVGFVLAKTFVLKSAAVAPAATTQTIVVSSVA